MLDEALGEEVMKRAVMVVAQCLWRLGPMLSRPEAFEVLMELSSSRVSNSAMWMSLSDELGV